jgi:hypothetical protein
MIRAAVARVFDLTASLTAIRTYALFKIFPLAKSRGSFSVDQALEKLLEQKGAN